MEKLYLYAIRDTLKKKQHCCDKVETFSYICERLKFRPISLIDNLNEWIELMPYELEEKNVPKDVIWFLAYFRLYWTKRQYVVFSCKKDDFDHKSLFLNSRYMLKFSDEGLSTSNGNKLF